jgi:methylenetetrahydrofolate--tRNA-(uracil-5-)-methyltransferase
MTARVAVIGGGLAGCEAAWQIATLAAGKAAVDLFEMRPTLSTPAHRTGLLAELVCSNSLKSESPDSPAGLLKEDLFNAGSLIIRIARESRVPAGRALAVDREAFAQAVTRRIQGNGAIRIIRQEMDHIPEGYDHVIVATGPLTSPGMADTLAKIVGMGSLYFYDAIAPIVEKDSVDMSIAFLQDRYGPQGQGDYLNLPMSKGEYEAFVDALLAAGKVEFREFEKEYYFDGCLPIEEIASRGGESLAFGPLKPVGLCDPATGLRPHAVVQLRKEDAHGLSYNMVGFQTKLKMGEQERVFRMIPGLASAVFLRLGSLHRNTYIDSPKALDGMLRLIGAPHARLAGQMTGVEGYMESAACGFLTGVFTAGEILGIPIAPPPKETAMGALLGHLAAAPRGNRFQPANMSFALFPPLERPSRDKKDRRGQILQLAREEMSKWLNRHDVLFSGRTDLSPGLT